MHVKRLNGIVKLYNNKFHNLGVGWPALDLQHWVKLSPLRDITAEAALIPVMKHHTGFIRRF